MLIAEIFAVSGLRLPDLVYINRNFNRSGHRHHFLCFEGTNGDRYAFLSINTQTIQPETQGEGWESIEIENSPTNHAPFDSRKPFLSASFHFLAWHGSRSSYYSSRGVMVISRQISKRFISRNPFGTIEVAPETSKIF